MNRRVGTIPAAWFETLYASVPDPWQFATSGYERDKYAETLVALPRARYAAGLEVGCSLGVLTEALADRCDALVAIDAAASPLAEARARCRDRPGVRIEQRFVPAEWPQGSFDLIVLSEVLYYLDLPDLDATCALVRGSLAAGGDVVLVHWTGQTDYPLSGDEAAERFIAGVADVTNLLRQVRHDRYRLDVLHRP